MNYIQSQMSNSSATNKFDIDFKLTVLRLGWKKIV